MTLLLPIGLAAGISLPILVVFYLLKVRRVDQPVSSTLLWEQLRRDLTAHEPWQKLKITALFVFQAAILAALVFALARPAEQHLSPASYFTAIVVDTSASMGATDAAPTRFDQAKATARQLIDSLPSGSTAALIAFGRDATTVVPETSDHGSLIAGLNQLALTDNTANVAPALQLAGALARGRPGAVVHLISDGAYAHPDAWDALQTQLVYHQIGGKVGNRAISQFAARPDPTNPGFSQLFARVSNFDDQAASVNAVLIADDKQIDSRKVDLAANGSSDLVFTNVPSSARSFQLKLVEPDALASDNTAALVQAPAPPVRILLVSRGNPFLQKALQVLPGASVDLVAPRSYASISVARYDVIIFDNYLPDALPTKNYLAVNPPDSPFFPLKQNLNQPPVTVTQAADPLLQYVGLTDLRIARSADLTVPDWAHPLMESNNSALMFAGESSGVRAVVVAFDLQQSNFPLLSGFPVFVANTVHYLQPPSVAGVGSYKPGDTVTIVPAIGVDTVNVTDPTGHVASFATTGQSVGFASTNRVGTYQVAQSANGKVVSNDQFAVNLNDSNSSDLRPRAALADRAAVGTQVPPGPQLVTNELWYWLLGLVAILMVGEWWWYHRRA